ncbi:MAG: hypothetical protein ABMA64_29535 [Myxococcota bacterium]
MGEYVAALYEAFLDEYGDPDLAQLATAALVQERLLEAAPDSVGAARAA